jgi:prepilin-type processing-associated H-X9-DG protein/prepilin-type N-terminal cleavage/methylation domain-containing protein
MISCSLKHRLSKTIGYCPRIGSFSSHNIEIPPRVLKGFTLIELLVTISIVVLLMAVSFPALQNAIEKSLQAQCANNLRQIGLGFQFWLQSNDNVLPQRLYNVTVQTDQGSTLLGYDELLLPYLGNETKIFRCPSHRRVNYPTQPSYGMNWYYDNANLTVVQLKSQTILATDTYGDGGTGSHRADRDSGRPGQLDKTRHQGKANYLFFDGHVERLKWEDTVAPVDFWGEDQGRHDEDAPDCW